MTRSAFNSVSGALSKPPRPVPFSIRLSADERSMLERKAGNKPLSGYIREQLLRDQTTTRKKVQSPKPDYVLLGKILAALGPSDLATSICMMAKLAEHGSLLVDDDCAKSLQSACDNIQEMRRSLIHALGLKSEGAQ